MTIDTNAIHTIRITLEELDKFDALLDDIPLTDEDRAKTNSAVRTLKRILTNELSEVEAPLIEIPFPDKVPGRFISTA